jgi:hypothetical protein
VQRLRECSPLLPNPSQRALAPQDIMRPARDFDEDEEMQSMGGYKDPEEGLQAIAAKATPMPKW